MAGHVRVREIDDDGRRLVRIVRRGTGSVVTWRRAQVVPLSAQGMPVARIAEVANTGADRVRDVIHNFNADGFDALYPKYAGGRPKDSDRDPRPRLRATYHRHGGVRHLFAGYDLNRDRIYGHVKPAQDRTGFLEFCRCLRTLYPPCATSPSTARTTPPHQTGQHDPPLHRLAQPPRRRQTPPRPH